VDIHTLQYKPGVYGMSTGRKGLAGLWSIHERQEKLVKQATLPCVESSGAKASQFPLRMQRDKRGKTGTLQSTEGLGAVHLSAREVSREQKNGDDQVITIRDKKEALEQDAYR
jgi:hypothetical protein